MDNGDTAASALVGAVTGDHRLILNPDAPLEGARELLRRNYLHELVRTLHHESGAFLEWRGTHYAEIAEEHIRAAICRFFDGAQRVSGQQLVAFEPTPHRVLDLLTMLRAEAQLPPGIRAPA